MRKVLVLVLAVCSAFAEAGNHLPSSDGCTRDCLQSAESDPRRLRLYCDAEPKRRWLQSVRGLAGLDFVRLPRAASKPIDVLVSGSKLRWFEEQLAARAIAYSLEGVGREAPGVEAGRRKRQLSARPFGGIDLTRFPRYDEIRAYLEQLARTHGEVVSYFSIGKSFEGRDIVGVKISSGSGTGKPAVLIDAGIHAREWIAPSTALYAVRELVENPLNRHLIEDVDVYVIPSVNPDGYEFSHLNNKTRLWRKTRSKSLSPICKGTDGNRNFELEWMSVDGSSCPCSEIFAGVEPFSEPETRALRNFMLQHKSQLKAYVSLHSYGNYFLYPWGFTKKMPSHERLLRCVAEEAEAELAKVRGTRYEIGSSTNLLYAASGGADDYALGVVGIELVYTMELPAEDYGFEAPASEIVPVGEETFEAFKVIIKSARGQICSSYRVDPHYDYGRLYKYFE